MNIEYIYLLASISGAKRIVSQRKKHFPCAAFIKHHIPSKILFKNQPSSKMLCFVHKFKNICRESYRFFFSWKKKIVILSAADVVYAKRKTLQNVSNICRNKIKTKQPKKI